MGSVVKFPAQRKATTALVATLPYRAPGSDVTYFLRQSDDGIFINLRADLLAVSNVSSLCVDLLNLPPERAHVAVAVSYLARLTREMFVGRLPESRAVLAAASEISANSAWMRFAVGTLLAGIEKHRDTSVIFSLIATRHYLAGWQNGPGDFESDTNGRPVNKTLAMIPVADLRAIRAFCQPAASDGAFPVSDCAPADGPELPDPPAA